MSEEEEAVPHLKLIPHRGLVESESRNNRFIEQLSATLKNETAANVTLPESVRNFEKQLSFQNCGGLSGCLEKAVAAREAHRKSSINRQASECDQTETPSSASAITPLQSGAVADGFQALANRYKTKAKSGILGEGAPLFPGPQTMPLPGIFGASRSYTGRLSRYNTETLEVSCVSGEGKGPLRLTSRSGSEPVMEESPHELGRPDARSDVETDRGNQVSGDNECTSEKEGELEQESEVDDEICEDCEAGDEGGCDLEGTYEEEKEDEGYVGEEFTESDWSYQKDRAL